MKSEDLLKIENLTTTFHSERGSFHAVDDISFRIKRGQTIGLVGESGCGKSVTSLSILRLLANAESTGVIDFEGQNLLSLSEATMRRVRGNRISMIFQEPMTSLNPVFTIGNQISEVFRIHARLRRSAAKEQAVEMLRLVNIPDPGERYHSYPHQLSGGMRQRVMIAMALACRPRLLIADEPTTALDVTIQAQILELMQNLQTDLGMSILLITHDLGVVAEVCDEVLVMYAGRIVEQGPVKQVFTEPKHPYTTALLKSIPRLGHKVDRLPTIEGMVPNMMQLPHGCRFQDRCAHTFAKCRAGEPHLTPLTQTRQAACWRATEANH